MCTAYNTAVGRSDSQDTVDFYLIHISFSPSNVTDSTAGRLIARPADLAENRKPGVHVPVVGIVVTGYM